jgi:hypothetical protein
MFADRKQRQLQQTSIPELTFNPAQRIGAGDDDRAVAHLLIVIEGHRLKPQHRRQQYLKAPGAETSGGSLIVRVRACDKNGHASRRRWRGFRITGRLHFKTPQC